jgi:integrase
MSASQEEVIFRGFDQWGWDNRTYSHNTTYNYTQVARSCHVWLRQNRKRSIFSANFQDLKAYLFERVKPSPNRRNQVRQALIAFCDYLVDIGVRTSNPARELPVLKIPKRVPQSAKHVAQELWNEAKASDPMVTALFALYFWGGLRRDEGRKLKWTQIDLTTRWMTVDGKGPGVREGLGKQRRIKMHPEMAWALSRWRSYCGDAEWIFPSPRIEGRPISESLIRRRLIEVGERVGIHLHPHLLRSTIATMMTKNSPIVAAQRFLGHESLETTKRYADYDDADVEAAVERQGFED